MRLFPYSGGKSRLLEYLPKPPAGTETIIEPFAGSLAYSLCYRPSKAIIMTELNPSMNSLWKFLVKECTVNDLKDFKQVMDKCKNSGEKIDVRDIGFNDSFVTLGRLMCASVMVGQLSSWLLYPKHTANVDNLIEMLPYIKTHVKVVGEDYTDAFKHSGFMFIDPPYMETSGNYIDKSGKHKLETSDISNNLQKLILKTENKCLVTYGDGAAKRYPKLKWKLALVRKVPILRGGGTRDRNEYFALTYNDMKDIKKMKFKIVSINFDTDGKVGIAKKLKTEWTGKTVTVDSKGCDEDQITDAILEKISDTSGWCVSEMDWVSAI